MKKNNVCSGDFRKPLIELLNTKGVFYIPRVHHQERHLQIEQSSGDYTRDREQILGDVTNEEIVTSIEARRRQQEKNKKT
jgi:hypothetical protein